MSGLVEFLRARLDEDEAAARIASHVLRHGAHWSLDEWHGREMPHSLIAQGTADQPVALGHFTADPVPTVQAAHIVRHDPARVLAEVRAKREILIALEAASSAPIASVVGVDAQDGLVSGLTEAVKQLASVYAAHPDCREEWKP